jgi:hypothetical protein
MSVRKLGLIALVVAGAVGPNAFAGGGNDAQSKLTIIASRINPDNEVPAQFDANGKVKSRVEACRKRRTVRLFRVRPGRDVLEGTDKTGKAGNWFIAGEVEGTSSANGTIYAKTPEARRSGKTCSADRSKNHVIDQKV